MNYIKIDKKAFGTSLYSIPESNSYEHDILIDLGFKPMTNMEVDYLSKSLNKPIIIYETDFQSYVAKTRRQLEDKLRKDPTLVITCLKAIQEKYLAAKGHK